MNLLEALAPHGVEEWQIPDPVESLHEDAAPGGRGVRLPPGAVAPRRSDRVPMSHRCRRGGLVLPHGSRPDQRGKITSLELVVTPGG
mgnify:CR=1 FL=1